MSGKKPHNSLARARQYEQGGSLPATSAEGEVVRVVRKANDSKQSHTQSQLHVEVNPASPFSHDHGRDCARGYGHGYGHGYGYGYDHDYAHGDGDGVHYAHDHA